MTDRELLEAGAIFFSLPPGDKEPPPTGITGKLACARLSRSERELVRQMGAQPGGNVGLLLGHRRIEMPDGKFRGVFVLDEDNKPARTKTDGSAAKAQYGEDTIAKLEAELGRLPPTLTAKTPGRGVHRIFWAPEEIFDLPAKVLAKSYGEQCGVDVLTEGRYIVYPGSSLSSEISAAKGYTPGAYEWVDPDAPVAELPIKWIDRLLKLSGGAAAQSTASTPIGEEPPYLAAVAHDRRQRDAAEYLGPLVKEGAGDGSGQMVKVAAIVALGFGCGVDAAAKLISVAPFAEGWDEDKIRKRCEDAVRAQKIPLGCRYDGALPADLAHLGAVTEPEAAAPRPTLTEGMSIRERLEAQRVSSPPPAPPSEPFKELGSLPSFPVDCLPPALRDFARAEAEATQTPVDMAAMMILGCCSAAIAGKVAITLGQWDEPLNLFVLVVAPPGKKKSGVLSSVLRPLRDAEEARIVAAAPLISAAKTARDLLTEQIKRAKSELAKLKPHEIDQEWKSNQTGSVPAGGAALRRQIGEMDARLRLMDVPAEPRLLADDVTMEGLAQLMSRNGGRMCLASAEGTIFGIAAGRYSGQASFEVLLKGHAGDAIVVDRKSKDAEPIRIRQGCVTAILAVQPSVVEKLNSSADMKGQGFLARWLYCLPGERPGEWDCDPPRVPEKIRTAYREAILALDSVLTPQEAAVLGRRVEDDADIDTLLDASKSAIDKVPTVTLGPEAKSLFREFRIEHHARMKGDLAGMTEWADKWPGAVGRIAGILHCVEHGPSGAVAGSTMLSAIEIGRYVLAHSKAALNLAQAAACEEDADILLTWLRGSKRATFSRRDLARGPRALREKKRREAALELLFEQGVIVPDGAGFRLATSGVSTVATLSPPSGDT